MKEKTLLILAAGMGSRFGSNKQIYPVGPNGEFIIDYSVYSAVKYGFNKVVFVIRREIEEEFKNTIGKRLEGKVKVEYVVQDLDIIPEGFSVPEGRVKPWGTAHALYCARNNINGNFAVIAADDFYGDESYKLLSNALDENINCVIGYKIGETLSLNGTVKRGVILSKNGVINKIIESVCEEKDGLVSCTPLNEKYEPFMVKKDNSVSMLMYGFTKDILDVIANNMQNEFENNKDNLINYEMLLPDMINEQIDNNVLYKDISTNSKWVGITYKEDADNLKLHIKKLIDENIYPNKLWENK